MMLEWVKTTTKYSTILDHVNKINLTIFNRQFMDHAKKKLFLMGKSSEN